MKALSIQQPWAWAILYAGKNVENRTWAHNYRGQILIHTGKKFDHNGYAWMIENKGILGLSEIMPSIGFPETYFKTGGIVGVVTIKKMVRSLEWSPWMFGPWGWVLENPEPIEFVPCRGKLGLFDIDIPNLTGVRNGDRTWLEEGK